jgi:hypothetical protein
MVMLAGVDGAEGGGGMREPNMLIVSSFFVP